jgi:hypothetical protein
LEDYIFHEGKPPHGYELDFEPALFNQQGHLYLQSAENWQSFFVLYKKYQHVAASIYFHIEDGVARSPYRSPFGSIEISPSLPLTVLFQFLQFIENRLEAHGVSKIVIKNPPAIYSHEFDALIQTFLFNIGYRVADAEVGSVISVSENSYECFPDSWERRKLRQAYETGLKFKQMEPDQLSEVYLFILACRKQRGYSLSMTLGDIKNAVDRFPEHYLLFGVIHEEKLAAASIAIRVKENILYNFYTAHPKEFDHVSPVVMIVEGMYGFCQQNNISLLDLGTSAIDGKPNFSLLDFKLRLGAQPTTKLTFEKKLD